MLIPFQGSVRHNTARLVDGDVWIEKGQPNVDHSLEASDVSSGLVSEG